MRRALVIFIILFVPLINVQAATRPDSINYSDTLSMDNELLMDVNKTILYGADIYSYIIWHLPMGEFTLSCKAEIDPGLSYILANGYPNKAITSVDLVDWNITQYAILLYLIDEGYINQSNDEGLKRDYTDFLNGYKEMANDPDNIEFFNKINELVQEAKEYQANYVEEIFLENNNTSLTLSQDGRYYESEFLKVNTGTAKTFKIEFVKAPDSVFVVDKNGKKKTELNIGEEFQIKIPANDIDSSSIRFKIKVQNVVDKFYLYKSIDQNLIFSSNKMDITLDDQYSNLILSTPYTDEFETEKLFFLNVKAIGKIAVPITSLNYPLVISIIGAILIVVAVVIILLLTKKKKA